MLVKEVMWGKLGHAARRDGLHDVHTVQGKIGCLISAMRR